MRETHVIGGRTLYNVHPAAECIGGSCTIHRPSDHHMRDWPLVWRNDRAMFERTCPHGIGHPDPDGVDFLGGGVHGCDGCCRPEESLDG